MDAFSASAKDIYEIGKKAALNIAAAESSPDGMRLLFLVFLSLC